MLRQIHALSVKELKTLLRDRGTLSALFLLPVVFVVIMTFAGVGNQGRRPVKLLVSNEDAGPLSGRIVQGLKSVKGLVVVDALGGVPFSPEAGASVLMEDGGFALVLAFPRDFTERVLASGDASAEAPVVTFITDPALGAQNLNPVEKAIEGFVEHDVAAIITYREGQRALDHLVADLPHATAEAVKALPQRFAAAMREGDLTIEGRVRFQQVAPAGLRLERPIKAEEQNVPGYTIFGIFFIVQAIGTTLLREKENGTFLRLAAAPLRRAILLIGKLVPFYVVNLCQAVVMFAFGVVVFGIGLGRSPLGLLAVTLATAAAANALGLLVAAISRSSEQMGPLSGVILVSCATIGGLFIPYFEMPRVLQRLSFATPHAWALKGFQDIIVRGYGLRAVLPSVGTLLAFAAALYVLALLRFRFD